MNKSGFKMQGTRRDSSYLVSFYVMQLHLLAWNDWGSIESMWKI